ncbi:hypothetical protein HTZ84_03760 [Haloterrigena sp. SYSU A558-1]|uniref:Uncharacterized protein n=1 Tax=Haloterrigena gelatinilytica TaxID=2741724 RepID=A0ABX2LAS6_9EURY|nr:hypothetical protein [Haloterrigena gelatinilytica]NUC71433.1 hypothetical protein [Haloterrigena gelatinilytica]
MNNTVRFDDAKHIRLSDVVVETRPPDGLEFAVEGHLSVSEALLGEFEGTTVNPVRVTVSGGDADSVALDLTGPATLRLETVDVGVAAPDREDLADGIDALRSSANDGRESVDSRPDVLSFTVEGEIRDVPSETVAALPADVSSLESVTFAADESVRSDGGGGDDVILELSLLGYGIVVRRDGSIVVGNADSLVTIDLD